MGGVEVKTEVVAKGELVPLAVKGKDVYNPTAPFKSNGMTVMAARVEDRRSETGSKTMFFRMGKEWEPLEDSPGFAMQDPFVSRFGEQLVLGGVRVDWKIGGIYQTVFYTGLGIYDLEYLAEGPKRMKDIRLVELEDSKLGVFTRPQGETGGLGKIGFTVINNLRGLTSEAIVNAELIKNQFGERQWGGVNQALLLRDGRIGVLGHVAEFKADGGKRYSVMAFVFDPVSRKSTPMRVIAAREDFPETPTKRPDLKHVVFPGGVVLREDRTAEIYVGLSDTSVGVIRLPNPWE